MTTTVADAVIRLNVGDTFRFGGTTYTVRACWQNCEWQTPGEVRVIVKDDGGRHVVLVFRVGT